MGLLDALRAATCRLSPLSAPRSGLSTKASPPGDRNILLMGAPGAGKTTVGRIVAHRLGLPAVDVDDDVLEAAWKMPVAAKLAAVGGERFLEEEGRALCNFSASGCVVSLTGSNPLHAAAMRRLKESGVVVYLDVDGEDVMRRLAGMKVNRIVGQEAGVSMRDILRYRRQFYEKWLDVRVLCGAGVTAEEVAEKVLKAVARYRDPAAETFASTRSDGAAPSDGRKRFSDVVIEGLAADGGLYVPKRGFPKMDASEWRRLVDMSYPERALVLLEQCIHPSDVSAPELRKMTIEAYGSNFSSEAVAPVKHLVGNQFVGVLSALQVVFHSSAYLDLCRDGVVRFGDPIDVCIPTGNFGNAMSAVYAKQMGVPIRKVICASNHNRVVADFLATGEYDPRGRPLVPSCSPAIDILTSSNLERFVHHVSGGDGALVKALFAGLDGGRRRRFRVSRALLGRMQREVAAGWCSEADCLAAMRGVHAQTGYLMDPHTAAAKAVADGLQDGSCPAVLCATAHYGKFAPADFQALRLRDVPEDPAGQLGRLGSTASAPEMHGGLMRCLEATGRRPHAVRRADYGVLVEEVESMIQDSFLKVV